MSGLNEQFLRVIYRKVPGLAKINKFIKDNEFTQNVTVGKTLVRQGGVRTPLADTLTINSGSVTLTEGTFFAVDTEGAGGTDDLDTINGAVDGREVYITPANDARTVVIKHATGNIETFDGGDVTLDDKRKVAKAIYDGSQNLWLFSGS